MLPSDWRTPCGGQVDADAIGAGGAAAVALLREGGRAVGAAALSPFCEGPLAATADLGRVLVEGASSDTV